jgi:hypothetical protein
MAQQTINVGAAPNDGTGTPLRTAFQYTNSNFTELYTALGGGSGLPGATTQVIFNDGGTNLAGDAGLVYNKTTDALTIGGNVQAASATITGDLTVDTSTLKVDSANNRVGVNTASPAAALHVATGNLRLADGQQLEFGGTTNSVSGSNASNLLQFYTNNVLRQTIDSSGNVGIGVTPSAWNSNYNALDIGQNGSISGRVGTSNTVDIASNGFRNSSGNWVYKLAASNTACRYQLDGSTGSHIWYSGAAGTAGNTITGFSTAAMTLDASGNLLVGKTAASVTTVGFQTLANGEVSAAMAASTSAATTFNVWSTGASAYRFYVGMNGTINATNTTISAISDARLKENVQDIDVGLGAILALKPRKFDWKAGKGKDIKGDRGFIAQEFEQVFPQLVDEWKDAAPEGEAPYKSVRQDLIPVLVKAIQELAAEVNALKNA